MHVDATGNQPFAQTNLQIKRTPPMAPTHSDDMCFHTTKIAPKEPEECDKMLKVSTWG